MLFCKSKLDKKYEQYRDTLAPEFQRFAEKARSGSLSRSEERKWKTIRELSDLTSHSHRLSIRMDLLSESVGMGTGRRTPCFMWLRPTGFEKAVEREMRKDFVKRYEMTFGERV